MLDIETQAFRPYVQAQPAGQPGRLRQPQTQAVKVQTPGFRITLPFEIGGQRPDRERTSVTGQRQRQLGYRNLSLYSLRLVVAPLARQVQIETSGKTGWQGLAQTAWKPVRVQCPCLHFNLTTPGGVERRVATQVRADSTFRAQTGRKVRADVQPVSIAVTAQIQIHAPDKKTFCLHLPGCCGRTGAIRSRMPIQPGDFTVLDDYFFLSAEQPRQIRTLRICGGGDLDAADSETSVGPSLNRQARLHQYKAVDLDASGQQGKPRQTQAYFLEANRLLASGCRLHVQLLYAHTGIESVPISAECPERHRMAKRAADVGFNLTLAFRQRR